MIQRLKKAKTVYLATQIVDMRKSINGLAAIDPASGTVHITTSDLVRLLDGLVMEQFIPHKDYSLY